jgi:riboflavin synthase
MRVGDEFGGHIVTGHIDGLAEVKNVTPEGESTRVAFEVPASLSRFVAPKGSVALDGVSLTVNEVDGTRFGVNLIPHTLKVTTFGRIKPGLKVNFEVDLMARYVARLVGK